MVNASEALPLIPVAIAGRLFASTWDALNLGNFVPQLLAAPLAFTTDVVGENHATVSGMRNGRGRRRVALGIPSISIGESSDNI
jgi:hypothetical protein